MLLSGVPQVTTDFRSTPLSPDILIIKDKRSHLHVICYIGLPLTDDKVSCLASTFETSRSGMAFGVHVSGRCTELEGMVLIGGCEAHLITGQYFTHSQVSLKRHATNFPVKY